MLRLELQLKGKTSIALVLEALFYCCDVDYDEKRLSLIRQIDFTWAVEKDKEKKNKQKSSKETSLP
ncbi:hypothetical protein JHK85_012823 [Glycine max]|nr:hypothetical protein JHK85_012823 [Glycine max]